MIEFFTTYKSVFIILHALAAAGGLGAVFVTDVLFIHFSKDRSISEKEFDTLKTISLFIWSMIVFLIVTGIFLFLSAPDVYMAKSKFMTKMIIFAVIVLNGILLHLHITPKLKNMSFVLESTQKIPFMKRLAFASGGISFTSWLIVFLLGSVRSIPLSTSHAIFLYGIVLVFVVLGSQIYLYKTIHKN